MRTWPSRTIRAAATNRSAGPFGRGLVFGASLFVLPRLEQSVGAMQELLRERLRERRAHPLLETAQRVRSPVGVLPGDELRIRALEEIRRAGRVAGRHVAIGEREAAVRLRQFGVVIAQQFHRARGIRRLPCTRLHHPRPAGLGRCRLPVHRLQIARHAFEVAGSHSCRAQVVGHVIRYARQLGTGLAQVGRRRRVVLLLVFDHAQRQLHQWRILRMQGRPAFHRRGSCQWQ